MIIYLATNIVNKKIYVGQTIKSLELRISQHKKDMLKRDFLFYRALRKYGFDNFKWNIIKECASKEELDRAEIELISKLGANDKKIGYNTGAGGSGGDNFTFNPRKEEIREIHRKNARSTSRSP